VTGVNAGRTDGRHLEQGSIGVIWRRVRVRHEACCYLQMMRMMRSFYERTGERRFDVEAHIPVGRGYVIIDHPGADLLQAGQEVAFGVEGNAPLGGQELNVPGLGKLVGTIRSADDDGSEENLMFEGILVPLASSDSNKPESPA
jgi:hypothetical protein